MNINNNLINKTDREQLDHSIIQRLEKLDESSFKNFMNYYENKKASNGKVYLSWLFGFHYAYFGRWAICALFIFLVIMFVGVLWWIVDAFRIPSMVREYNNKLAIEILSMHKLSYRE